MTNLLAKAGMAAALSFAALFGTVSTASADGIGFGIYVDGPGRGWDAPRHGHGWDGPPRRHRACAPGHALDKARYSGLRRAHVRDVTPRRVVVAGLRQGYPDRMVFANVRGCPVLRR